jgi:hypothetical protein
MRITRIDLAGENGASAVVQRKPGSPTVTASILTPERHLELSAKAGDRNDLFTLATCVQTVLDGARGTTGVIREYFRAIEQMAD